MLLIDLAIRSRIMQLQRARKSIVCTFILLSTENATAVFHPFDESILTVKISKNLD